MSWEIMEAMAFSSCFWQGSESFHLVKLIVKVSADGWSDRAGEEGSSCVDSASSLNNLGGARVSRVEKTSGCFLYKLKIKH